MSEARIVQCARIMATVAHKGQTDKAGKPYIHHPERVAASVKAAGGSDDAQAVAWLHDVVEDTDLTLADLFHAHFPLPVVKAVDALTRRKGEDPAHYYVGVRADPLALLVKEHDIADNASPIRLAMLERRTRERLEAKYAKARKALGLTVTDSDDPQATT